MKKNTTKKIAKFKNTPIERGTRKNTTKKRKVDTVSVAGDEIFKSFYKKVSAVNTHYKHGLKMVDLKNWLKSKYASGNLECDNKFFMMSYGKTNKDIIARAVIYLASVYLEPNGECFICKNNDKGRSAFIYSPRLAGEISKLIREDVDVDTERFDADENAKLHSIGIFFPVGRKLKTFGNQRIQDIIDAFHLQAKNKRKQKV